MKKHNFFVIIFCVILASCASNKDVNGVIVGLQNKSDINKFVENLDSTKPGSKNYLLSQQELGRINFIKQNPKASISYFNNAVRTYNIIEEKGALDGLLSSTVASTLLDDNAIDYEGSDFERAMVYFYSALSYLNLGKLNEAMVDIRASYDIQKFATAKREKDIAKVNAKLKNYTFIVPDKLEAEINKNQQEVANAKNKFLNSYLFYVSGLIREAKGELNNALIDYKNALELYPNNTYLLQNAIRLSAIYDRAYYNKLTQQNPNVKTYNQQDYNKQTTVHIVYEQGFIPQKESFSINLLINNKLAKVALPVYNASNVTPFNVNIAYNNNSITATEIGNIYNMAKFNLNERFPYILLRQLTRISSKTALQSGLSDNGQDASGLGTALYFVGAVASLTEQADLRGFYTLPALIQNATIYTNNNLDSISVNVNNGKNINIPLQIKSNKPENIIVLVTDTGNAMYYNILLRQTKFN